MLHKRNQTTLSFAHFFLFVQKFYCQYIFLFDNIVKNPLNITIRCKDDLHTPLGKPSPERVEL